MRGKKYQGKYNLWLLFTNYGNADCGCLLSEWRCRKLYIGWYRNLPVGTNAKDAIALCQGIMDKKSRQGFYVILLVMIVMGLSLSNIWLLLEYLLFFLTCLTHNFKTLHENTLKYIPEAVVFIAKQGKVSLTCFLVWVSLSFQPPTFLRCQVVK